MEYGEGGWLKNLFSLGEASPKRLIIAGAAALVIIVSLVFAVRGYTSSDMSKSVLPSEFHFKCLACGNEKTWKPNEVPAYINESLSDFHKCDKCGKVALVREVECPKCHTVFVPQGLDKAYKSGGLPDDEKVCPNCHLDVAQYYFDKNRNAGR